MFRPTVTAILGIATGLGCSGIFDDHADCTDVDFGGNGCIIDEPKTDAGNAADGGSDVVAPPHCDLAKSPRDATACLDDAVGVFVSPLGDDTGPGHKNSPVKTVGKGIELAGLRGLPRVYVCEGTYAMGVEITAPVSIYGGLSCGWTYTGAKPKLAPPKGIALHVMNVSGDVLVEDFEVEGAADKDVAGDSAIAAFVSKSTKVTFRGVMLTAGAGSAGTKGASRSNYTGTTASKGENGSGAKAGSATTCACDDATSSIGGSGASGDGLGVENGSANPSVGGANSGLTGATTCIDGQTGANGSAGGAGAPSASAGALEATGWTNTMIGPNAPNGNPAQGGGGGGAKTDVSSAGGGGGCGGCGGAGGAAGTNGGSSFALLSFNSTVIVEGGHLVSGDAGHGGDGGDGQPGQAGGSAGTGPACNGGPGGNGAGGSGGPGGVGGTSAPVAFVGTEPRISGATLGLGAKGTGGIGGAGGAGPSEPGTAGATGPDGKAQNALRL